MPAFPDLSSYAYSPKKIDQPSVDVIVKDELPEDVAALALSTPTTETPPGLRRSPRKRAVVSLKEESDEDAHGAGGSSSSSRTRTLKKEEVADDELPVFAPSKRGSKKRKVDIEEDIGEVRQTPTRKSPKKAKREYAPPETYAHLETLNDCLKEHLDVMFCGINPGCMSARTGHHFAHPTNHFWKCLHHAGFTDRLLKPSEDMTLPEAYNIGLTNLVERPSAEAAELSHGEMNDGVPAVLAKIALYCPRVVCFVGKGIGEIFLKEASARALPLSEPPLSSADDPLPATKPKKKVKAVPFAMGFQPYKILHPNDSVVKETLFFITPSSSGRVTGYQLVDKVKIVKTLYDQVQKLKAGEGMDTSSMKIIPLPTIADRNEGDHRFSTSPPALS